MDDQTEFEGEGWNNVGSEGWVDVDSGSLVIDNVVPLKAVEQSTDEDRAYVFGYDSGYIKAKDVFNQLHVQLTHDHETPSVFRAGYMNGFLSCFNELFEEEEEDIV